MIESDRVFELGVDTGFGAPTLRGTMSKEREVKLTLVLIA